MPTLNSSWDSCKHCVCACVHVSVCRQSDIPTTHMHTHTQSRRVCTFLFHDIFLEFKFKYYNYFSQSRANCFLFALLKT